MLGPLEYRHKHPRSARRSLRHYQPFAAAPSIVIHLVVQWLNHHSRASAAATSRRMLDEGRHAYSWPATPLVPLRHSQWLRAGTGPQSLLALAPISLHLQLYHRTLDVAALVPHLRSLSHLQLSIRVNPQVGVLRPPSARQLRRLLRAARPHFTICIHVLTCFRMHGNAEEVEKLAALARVSQRVSVAHSHEYQQA